MQRVHDGAGVAGGALQAAPGRVGAAVGPAEGAPRAAATRAARHAARAARAARRAALPAAAAHARARRVRCTTLPTRQFSRRLLPLLPLTFPS